MVGFSAQREGDAAIKIVDAEMERRKVK